MIGIILEVICHFVHKHVQINVDEWIFAKHYSKKRAPNQWRIEDFPEMTEGIILLFSKTFSKICMKMKEIGPRGRTSLALRQMFCSLASINIIYYQTYLIIQIDGLKRIYYQTNLIIQIDGLKRIRLIDKQNRIKL